MTGRPLEPGALLRLPPDGRQSHPGLRSAVHAWGGPACPHPCPPRRKAIRWSIHRKV